MDRNVISPIPPEELLEERAINRLVQSGEAGGSVENARRAFENLNDAQRIGVGNLGLSLEQVQNPNYTEHTPEALIRTIEGHGEFDFLFGENTVLNSGLINDFLNEASPDIAMDRVNMINQFIVHSSVEGREEN